MRSIVSAIVWGCCASRADRGASVARTVAMRAARTRDRMDKMGAGMGPPRGCLRCYVGKLMGADQPFKDAIVRGDSGSRKPDVNPRRRLLPSQKALFSPGWGVPGP